jgi:hypothetical protein
MFSVLFNLSGCVYAKYNAADGKEELTVISLLKEVDGFSADRKKDSFNIMIDKTRSSDPFEGLAELIETWTQLQNMGISYTPPGTTIPFPVE